MAGAGGAAHLPGMVAALTDLPVIGVPVRGSNLEGLDSLLSIVQMPRGVPVATVAINNARNAGLLAARILGVATSASASAWPRSTTRRRAEVIEKARRLEADGWKAYLEGRERRVAAADPRSDRRALSPGDIPRNRGFPGLKCIRPLSQVAKVWYRYTCYEPTNAPCRRVTSSLRHTDRSSSGCHSSSAVLVNAVDRGRRLVASSDPRCARSSGRRAHLAGLPPGSSRFGPRRSWPERAAAGRRWWRRSTRSWRRPSDPRRGGASTNRRARRSVLRRSRLASSPAAARQRDDELRLLAAPESRRRGGASSNRCRRGDSAKHSNGVLRGAHRLDLLLARGARLGQRGELDLAAQRIALETPEFRHRFLALARTDEEAAMRLVPRLFGDYRRGFLLVDQRFLVRLCSARGRPCSGDRSTRS